MSNDDSPLDARIAKWLHSHGYPLEMTVAAALRRQGFRVIQSAYLLDPESSKPRELDVLAYRQWEGSGITWQITLLVECKLSKQPWVMFTLPTPPEFERAVWRFHRVAGSRLSRHFLAQVRRRHDADRIELFNAPVRLAYGVRQALGGNEDEPYDANAKLGKLTAVQASLTDGSGYEDSPVVQVVVPAVILDSQLFESYLSNEDELQVVQTPAGVLDWSNPIPGSAATWIHIISVHALDVFVAAAKQTADFLEFDCVEAQKVVGNRWLAEYEQRHRPPERSETQRIIDGKY